MLDKVAAQDLRVAGDGRLRRRPRGDEDLDQHDGRATCGRASSRSRRTRRRWAPRPRSWTAISQQMAGNAEETATQTNVVSAASEQVSKNLTVVATSSEEMLASIREIAKSANEAARMAKNAVGVADDDQPDGAEAGRLVGRRSATSSRSSPRLPSRPTCWRSTRRSKRRGPGTPARASPWWPTR